MFNVFILNLHSLCTKLTLSGRSHVPRRSFLSKSKKSFSDLRRLILAISLIDLRGV